MPHILDPVVCSNLAVYLLQFPCRRPSTRKQPAEAPVEFLTLDSSLAAGQVIVHETGTIERLRVENLSHRDLFLQAGEVLRGGLQDRALAIDLIVPRRRYETDSGVTVPAFCMEEERWEMQPEQGDVFRSAGQMVPTRRLKLALRTGTQEKISREVAALENTLRNLVGLSAPGFSMGLSLWTMLDAPHLKDRLEEWTRPLIRLADEHPAATGAVFALHGQFNSAEQYATPALFRQMWPKLLWSAAVEALVEPGSNLSQTFAIPSKGEITAWLAALHGRRVTSAPGIAHASAMRLLAELLVLPADLKAPQWVAHAGLDPRPQESGSSIHKPRRITKTGNRHLRTALFMPALVAVRCHGHVKACYDALVARGKRPKQALVAVMRKLLHAIWGMLKHAQDFDAARFFQLPQETQKTA